MLNVSQWIRLRLFPRTQNQISTDTSSFWLRVGSRHASLARLGVIELEVQAPSEATGGTSRGKAGSRDSLVTRIQLEPRLGTRGSTYGSRKSS
jgi:hypothetical protein